MIRKEKGTLANNFKNAEQRRKWNTYNNNYAKKNYRTYCLKLNKVKDKDIIDFLDSCSENITTVFKNLLREKIGSRE